ncbi:MULTISPECIES: VOC family protein [unclassified Mycobacterium]|uniref:VOC family protein n=1 Tax=unclassified Mycobacterium TaxID=2642494 RepID=UPI00048EAD00|nr:MULTISPECIES: VOC family protein [unclassified Mycobacterium]SEB26079.1 Glyoxalase/Bleomycin resistance protein/Dioxygenase superfamily protein [Mycobacterium sp. 283mftsu]
MPSPEKLAHVVLRTGRVREMTDWYVRLLDGEVAFANQMLAFMTYDEEHHRIAFVATGASEPPEDRHTGLHHVAFTFGSMQAFLDNYTKLKNEGVQPFWCVNHGPTLSMYYRDPDGNQIELQIDAMTNEETQNFVTSEAFATNPIGITFEPEELITRFEAGEPFAELVKWP